MTSNNMAQNNPTRRLDEVVVGAGFDGSARCSSRCDVVHGSVGMLFGRGCLRFGRSARP